MIELTKISGLPIKLSDDNKLILSKELKQLKPDIRTLQQMKPVLLDSKITKPKKFYYMYRSISLKSHTQKFNKADISYDVTVLPFFRAGIEFNKTFGHFHPKKPKTNTTYPEIYEVLSGRAYYFMQKKDDFVEAEALPGNKVIIPPGYGHVTVNPGPRTLVMCNLIKAGMKSDYAPFKKNHGAMYYETVQGIQTNQNYKTLPKLRQIPPLKFGRFGLMETPIYQQFILDPNLFKWLTHPEQYEKEFVGLLAKPQSKPLTI